ncbi:MAG: hypothetical protein CSA32_03855 [Desulfobulbus propionicus]|nr:MAG: hypothetical protein CSA32_03855 [Desulfobulbus propionicus]
MPKLFTYRKRTITDDDAAFIRDLITRQPDIGRCALSRKVCKAWRWVQPNGHLKDIVCRSLMLKLEREGYLKLPPRISTPNNPLAQRRTPAKINISQEPVTLTVKALSPIQLVQVRKSKDEKVFNFPLLRTASP